ncbi:hypothetical protein [Robinsoniella sp. KNHs210]|uniref:hypothetical protein n=1 Tax=Robinsoniella sp. KNHs210 TaxID=1469950 RepID=UPI0012DD0DEB|nr:hypothetical protein [Robinsoniella sp. KNHs210]
MKHTTATHMLGEVFQETMNRQLKAWNDRWFLEENPDRYDNREKRIIPDFLK